MFEFLEDIITVITTLAAALVGIVGNTWDNKKKGIKKVTPTGWTAIILALIGLYSTVDQSIKKHKHVITVQQLNNAATIELNNDLAYFMRPFYTLALYKNDTTFKEKDLWSLMRENYENYSFFDSLINARLLSENQIEAIDFHDKPSINLTGYVYQDQELWKIFFQTFSSAKSKIDNTLSKYSPYISEEVLIKVNRLLNSDFCLFITEELPFYANSNSAQKEIKLGTLFSMYLQNNDDDEVIKQNSFLKLLGELRDTLTNQIKISQREK